VDAAASSLIKKPARTQSQQPSVSRLGQPTGRSGGVNGQKLLMSAAGRCKKHVNALDPAASAQKPKKPIV
jgi:hypothetical protein